MFNLNLLPFGSTEFIMPNFKKTGFLAFLTFFVFILSLTSAKAQCNASTRAQLVVCMNDNVGRTNIQITGDFQISTTISLENNTTYNITTNGRSVSWSTGMSAFSGGNGNTTINITTPSGTTTYDNNNAPTIQGNLNPLGNLDPALLPVEMVFFRAEKINNQQASLVWQTASELNNEMFQVERSADGSNFQVIGKVDGAGTTFETQTYQFSDLTPLAGRNYYRIKQIDFDGSFDVSPVTSVNFTSDSKIAVYPTIAESLINIENGHDSNSDVSINIYSMNGMLMESKVLNGTGINSLDVSHLLPGTYILQSLSDNQLDNHRFIKL